jgi:glycosyltransferase involved in cell wall biosynthesis
MKILCINYEYPPVGGGGGVVAHGLARTLAGMGYQIDVVTSGCRGLPPFEEKDGVGIHRVPCVRLHRYYVTAPELATVLYPLYKKALALTRQKNYAFNHTHFIVPSGFVSYKLWQKTGLPYLITAHGSDVPGYNPDRFGLMHRFIRKPWSAIIKNSLLITTPSRYLKDLLLEKIDHPGTVIPNGFDFFTERTTGQTKRNRIVLVTRMFERKGVQFFLRAIAGIKTDWEIIIAGDGPYLPKLKEEARRNNSPVTFLGFIQGRQLTELYQSARIFVFPSIQENFPVVLLEAMNAGCAVITTTAPGCVEVVDDAAVLVGPGEVAQLRQALVDLMHDPLAIETHAARSLKRAGEFYWPNVARQFVELFRSLPLAKQPSRQG